MLPDPIRIADGNHLRCTSVGAGCEALWEVISEQRAWISAKGGMMARALSQPFGRDMVIPNWGGRGRAGVGCFFVVFFGMFLLVGSLFLYMLTIVPMMGLLASDDWVETPCQIVVSDIKQRRGEDGPVLVWDLQYEYTVGGKTYRGDRYNFMSGMSVNGGRGQRQRAKAYPQGSQRVCFVDPDDPTSSVLNREFSSEMWWGLFPIPFVAVGAGGLLFWFFVFRTKTSDPESPQQPAMLGWPQYLQHRVANSVPEATDSGPILLEPESSLVARLCFLVVFAVFWNGIVSVFVYQAYRLWAAGNPQWFLMVFLIPFVLIGAGFLLAIPYTVLSMLNPKPILQLSRSEIPLGESAVLNWHFQGRTSSIRRLVIRLECEERATYQRGTDTHTDTSTLFRQTLYDRFGLEIATGRVEIDIPFDAMHSFDAPDNKIVWAIKVEGEIPLRPDVSRSCRFHVTPHSSLRQT